MTRRRSSAPRSTRWHRRHSTRCSARRTTARPAPAASGTSPRRECARSPASPSSARRAAWHPIHSVPARARAGVLERAPLWRPELSTAARLRPNARPLGGVEGALARYFLGGFYAAEAHRRCRQGGQKAALGRVEATEAVWRSSAAPHPKPPIFARVGGAFARTEACTLRRALARRGRRVAIGPLRALAVSDQAL